MNYVVWAPPYEYLSGGIKVLHKFAYELSKIAPTFITTKQVRWDIPYFDQMLPDHFREGVTVIYPEVISGNPLGIPNVARYLLNNAGKLAGDKVFPETDELFAFSQLFNDFNLPEERILWCPAIETDIFYDFKKERTEPVFYVGKGGKTSDFTNGMFEITKPFCMDQSALAQRLNTATVLYTYDNITGMSDIARLCGCPVVIIPNGEYTKEQYSKHELGLEGISWGLDEGIKEFSSEEFRQKYLDMEGLFRKRLKLLVETLDKVKN